MSTTEAEYVCLSQSLRDAIPLMRLLTEIQQKLDPAVLAVPAVRSTLFEDNSGALELAHSPKMRPRTKHINIKYHHFRDHVRRIRWLICSPNHTPPYDFSASSQIVAALVTCTCMSRKLYARIRVVLIIPNLLYHFRVAGKK